MEKTNGKNIFIIDGGYKLNPIYNINIYMLILMILSGINISIFTIILLDKFLDKVLVLVLIWGGGFFTALAFVVNSTNNTDYIGSYILFFLSMIITTIVILKNNKKVKIDWNIIFEENKKIFIFLGILCFILQLSSLIYPEFKLFDLLKIPGYEANSNVFQERIATQSNSVLWIIERLKVLTLPFFYIWLYNERKKAIKVISIFLFYYYIDWVKNGYISRSAIVVYITFIILYLAVQNIISKKMLFIIIIVSIFTLIPLINVLEYLRVGKSISNNNGFLYNLLQLISSEGENQKYLNICNSFSNELSFGKYILYGISSPLFFLPDIDFPVLSYAFTERILGLKYGQANYYILLPGSFGEGIMIFGKYFSWLYGIFIGGFTTFFYKFFTRNKFMTLWGIMYIMDLARSFRGGTQTFFIATINTSLLLFMVLILLKFKEDKKLIK